jgi:cell wall-associated NlpC family hydrolase
MILQVPRKQRVRRSVSLLVVAGAAAIVCAMPAVGAAQEPPKPFEALSVSAQALRDSIVETAKAQLGKRYRLGGVSPEKGFDCSGLVQYVMAALKLDVPRTARQQAKTGFAVTRDTSRLLPGDLLTFGWSKKSTVSHIGIYIGDGKFIHASSVAGRVIISPVNRPVAPLIKAWKGARRLLSLDDDSSAVVVTAPGTRG